MANGDLLLHKEKGVNPRISVCQACGEDVGVVLLGAREYKGTCPNCEITVYGATKRGRCDACKGRLEDCRVIADTEKVPGGLCDDCAAKKAKEKEAIDAILKGGGVLFRCAACGCRGAMPKSEQTEHIRKNALAKGLIPDIDAMFGIEMGSCDEHGKVPKEAN